MNRRDCTSLLFRWIAGAVVLILAGALSLFIRGPIAPAQSAYSLSPSSLRECATCHLNWVETFEHPDAIVLIDQPDLLTVSEGSTCLGCHDGSVADSRQRVWVDHGHQTGIAPPSDMSIPDNLPLHDGTLACRTCHTAHGGSGDVDIATTVFLRVPNEESRMCQLCHSYQTLTPVNHFSHPQGKMDEPIPVSLLQDGAHAGVDATQLYCESCHTPHGSRADHLLLLGTESNELCLACHTDQRPALWQDPPPGKHPDRPVIQHQHQLEAITQMGTSLGQENRLICLSCHRMHDARSEEYLLAGTLDDAKFCLQCHPDQITVEQTSHDPRQFDQASLHVGGLQLNQENSCSACHLFHELTIPAVPDQFDQEGLCNSCHRAEGVGHTGNMTMSHSLGVHYQAAIETVGGDGTRPSPHLQSSGTVECNSCHDPHDGSQPAFLKDSPDALCASCHADVICCMSGAHDIHEADTWPFEAPYESRCLSCHKTHAWEQDPTLYTFPLSDAAVASADATCMGCHNDIHWEAITSPTVSHRDVLHPQFVQMENPPDDLYLDGSQSDQILSCHTCHDPHGKPNSIHLLFGSDQGVPEQSCYRCHDHTRGLSQTPHGYVSTPKQDHATSCQACHQVHAGEDVRPDLLFVAPTELDQPDPSATWCLGCHEEDSEAGRPFIVTHPEPLLIQGALRYWYANSDAMPKALQPDRMTCVVCHMPHGRPQPEIPTSAAHASLDQLRAQKMLLRPGTAEEFCAQCHRDDAKRLFLYYHFPAKRD